MLSGCQSRQSSIRSPRRIYKIAAEAGLNTAVRRPMKNPDQVDLARAFLRSEELLALPHMPIQAE
jgi:hypothetical protein